MNIYNSPPALHLDGQAILVKDEVTFFSKKSKAINLYSHMKSYPLLFWNWMFYITPQNLKKSSCYDRKKEKKISF